jgi:molybdopterin/thiamine biosynthesis adenylyltransferase
MGGRTANSQRRRWHENGRLAEEVAGFEARGLAFALDPVLLARGVVVFDGELRLDDKRVAVKVVYPPAYAQGEPVAVVAPDLPIGRHKAPNGVLCLEHPVFGDVSDMTGADAVERAERLWYLWVNDRDQLRVEEADAPDPRANYYLHEPGSAVVLVDADVSGVESGWLRVGLTSLVPFRAGLVALAAREPKARDLAVASANRPFAGEWEICGFWRRVEPADAYSAADVFAYAVAEHSNFLEHARNFAAADSGVAKRPVPALVGFVYRDEGPGRNQWHDAWLFLLVRPDGAVELPHPFLPRSDERWLRQPQLEPLGGKRVGLVGAGALGSPLAGLLAQAGVGAMVIVDYDIVTVGNRVRHELDLSNLGELKVAALARRLVAINPWLEVDVRAARFGGAFTSGFVGDAQRLDDELADLLGGCDLVINASAHTATAYHLAALGRDYGVPVVHTWVSAGAWGARVLLERPGLSGCPECLAWTQKEPERAAAGATVPDWSADPAVVSVVERGCADPTFTGPGFELEATAAAACRLAVQALLDGDGYPAAAYDLATLRFRSADGSEPETVYTRLPPHPDCSICNG